MRREEAVEGVGLDDRQRAQLTPANGHTRRDVLIRTGMFGAAVSLSGILAACGDSSGGSAATQGSGAGGEVGNADVDNFTMGFAEQAPTSLDVAAGFTLAYFAAASPGLEGLLTTDDELQLRPALARGWSQPDLLNYVFDLRPGVQFWDGSPLTVEDAAFSIERHLDPSVGSQIAFHLEGIKSVEVKGDSRLVITMASPNPVIPQILTFVPILPKKYVERTGDDLGVPGSTVNVVGTGPFEITAFSTETGVEYRRNENYWGKHPKVKSASLKYFGSRQTMLLAARSKSVDGGFEFPQAESKSWSAIPGMNTDFPEGVTTTVISFDMESEPWNDIHVRRAVAHCCDSEGYVNAFMAGQAVPATSIVPKRQWAAIADPAEVDTLYETFKQYPFDIDAAKAELAQSAFPDGFSATVPYLGSLPAIGQALVSLSHSLKEIGIDLEVKAVSDSQWLTDIVEHKNLGMQVIKYAPDYNDPSNYPMVLFPSANAVPNAFNAANFKNPKVDRLLEEQASTTDNEKRTERLGEALRIAADELPYLGIWWEGPTLGISDEFVFNGFNPLYYFQPWLEDVAAPA